jgi:4,5-epoxidase
VISQALVEAELRRRVGELGGEIVWGREVAAAKQDGHGVSVGLADGGQCRVGWLVGCDGAHSRVRQLAGVGFAGVALAERFQLVDVHAELPLSRQSIHLWLDGDGALGAFPLPGPDLWRLMAPAADPGTETDLVADDAVVAEIAGLLGQRTGCDPALIGDPDWVTSFRVHRRLAATYRSGRILLAGDAAHVHSPFGAQGMNSGIADAENLAWKLAMVVNATAQAELLDSYQAERRPVAANGLGWSGAAASLSLGRRVWARLLRDRAIIPLLNKASVQRRAWENLSQLKVTYRSGPLGRRARKQWFFGRGPLPGDRVRDVHCLRSKDGRQTTLYAELGNNWALVMPGRMARGEYAAVAAKRLGDDGVTTLVADHDPTGEIMLVRPDAHLGWRGRADPDALDRWLTAMARRGRAG